MRGLLAVFVLALAVRAAGIGERPFWLDEASTLGTIAAPDVASLLDRVRHVEVGKGPAYFLLLREWSHAFGTGAAALRWPSALAGAAAAGAVYAWARGLARLIGGAHDAGASTARIEAAALLAGVVAALHPRLVELSREARPYSSSHLFLFLAGACSVPAYLADANGGLRRAARIATPVLAAIGASSHLHGAFFVAGLFAAVGLFVRSRGRSILPVVVGAAGFAVCMLPQVPLTVAQAHVWAGPRVTFPAFGLRDVAHEALLGLGGSVAGLAVGALVALALIVGRRLPLVRIAVVTAACGVALDVVLDRLGTPILTSPHRYLAWTAGPLALAAAAFPLALVRVQAWIASGALVAALAAGIVEDRIHENRYTERWDEVAALLTSRARPDDVVACHAGHVASALLVYYGGPARVVSVDDLFDAEGHVDPTLAAAHRDGRSTWLVWSHAGELTREERERLERALGPSEEVHAEFAIHVLRFGG